MRYRVVRIDEDIDFGCEERKEGLPVMAVVLLEEEPEVDIHDKIVVVPKADPGYEWVFAKRIKGFITCYGGAASHMAIRCAEFNIPAAIGCGDVIYNYVTGLDKLTLDCKNGKILKEE